MAAMDDQPRRGPEPRDPQALPDRPTAPEAGLHAEGTQRQSGGPAAAGGFDRSAGSLAAGSSAARVAAERGPVTAAAPLGAQSPRSDNPTDADAGMGARAPTG